MDDRLTLEAAATAIGRSVATLGRWIRERRIAVVRVLGRTYVTRAEVDRVSAGAEVPARADDGGPMAPKNGAARKKGRRG